ncbi:hypothetical protein ACFL1H_07280, partial [Nanoarchaeota archaeon]
MNKKIDSRLKFGIVVSALLGLTSCGGGGGSSVVPCYDQSDLVIKDTRSAGMLTKNVDMNQVQVDVCDISYYHCPFTDGCEGDREDRKSKVKYSFVTIPEDLSGFLINSANSLVGATSNSKALKHVDPNLTINIINAYKSNIAGDGFFSGYHKQILIDHRLEKYNYFRVLSHELGHAVDKAHLGNNEFISHVFQLALPLDLMNKHSNMCETYE